jgi:uncharacterized lipoprotein YmbA
MIRNGAGLAILAALFLGCGTSKITRFYLPEGPHEISPGRADGLVIGVRNVELPEYLRNDYMPEIGAGGELRRDEFSRWAAPFGDVFEGLLISALRAEGVAEAVAEPWPDFIHPRCNVWVRVNRWAAYSDQLLADVSWSVIETDRREAPLQRFLIKESRDAADSAGYARISALVISRLGSEVAADVKSRKSCQAQYVDKK